jgi:putative chitinase
MLTLELLQTKWPHADVHIPGLLKGIAAAAPAVFPKYGVTANLVIAHFMAQASEECGAGQEMVENMNYSATGLLRTFPTHFTQSMAAHYAHNPEAIADIAYGGRMGNRPGTHDGYNYRGRGLSQVTGYDGYLTLGNKLSMNLLADPDLVNDPDLTLECGVADWVICGCLPYAEKDDIVSETRRLNGGLNGLAERRRWLGIWKQALGV